MTRTILTIFAIIIAILFLSYFSRFLGDEWENFRLGILPLTQETSTEATEKKQTTVGSNGSAALVKPQNQVISFDTYITSGPEENETIGDTNIVTFEYEARISSENTSVRVSFETKIEGLDENWQATSSKTRKVTFPGGVKEYTFLVRAKVNDVVDSTPAERTFKINISPYFQKVKITKVYLFSSGSGRVNLKANVGKEEEINITGWKLESRQNSFVIPQGIEKYLYGYADEDIIVKSGDSIYLSEDANPLGRNKDFRPNKCFGYLAKYHSFPIPVSGCPKLKEDEISHLSICCQEFITRSIKGCEVPDYSKNYKIIFDRECIDFLNENFNYQGCFNRYSKNDDFLKKEWHIYMRRDLLSTCYKDTLYLKDGNGLLVDKYSYGTNICK